MIKGEVNEISTENFNQIRLELGEQFEVNNPIDVTNAKREWNVKPSKFALNTTNPIRAIVEHLNVQPNPDKAFIPLSVGKRRKFGHSLHHSYFHIFHLDFYQYFITNEVFAVNFVIDRKLEER